MHNHALSVLLAVALSISTSGVMAANLSFDEVLQAVQDGDYATAAARVHVVAEQGDPRAQEILGFMLIWGERLYGAAVRTDPVAGRKWLAQAASSGREAAAFYLRRFAERQAAQQVTTDSQNLEQPSR